MKKFDIGYVYSHLLSDFVYSIGLLILFFADLLFDEGSKREDIIEAIPLIISAFFLIYICLTVYRILYYKTSGYELTETEIRCKRGVFFKKSSILEYSKIHAVNKKQNIIQMIFGVATLTIDSGSANTSTQAEITVFEKSSAVDALMSKLNSAKENGYSDAWKFRKEELLLSENDALFSFTSKRKMLYTAISIISAIFYTAAIGILAVAAISACKTVLQQSFLGTWSEYLLMSVTIFVAAVLIVSLVSFIGCLINSFVKYHGFKITKCNGNLIISYGLLEKHTNSFSFDRVTAVKISQGLVERMLGFASIRLEVIGYLTETGNNTTELGILVPFCKIDEVGEILDRVLPGYKMDEKQTSSVSLFPFVSWFFLILGIISAVTVSLTVAVMHILGAPAVAIYTVSIALVCAAMIVCVLKLLSAVLEFKNNGIAFENGKITAYSGGFTKNITVFMAKNVIAIESITTPKRQKAGIKSYVLHLRTNEASNEIKVRIQKDTLEDKLPLSL